MTTIEHGRTRAVWLAASMAATACYTGGDPSSDGGEQTSDDAGGSDGTDSGPEPASCSELDVGPTPLRRLTRSQYDNTIRDLLGIDTTEGQGLVSDEKAGPFDANAVAAVAEVGVEKYMDAAQVLATQAVDDIETLVGCDPAVDGELACTRSFIESFGRRAFRRPVTPQQVDGLLGVYDAAETFEDGIRLVVAAMLQSPYFVYHLEEAPADSTAVVALEAYALASRLSYFLWNSMPDDGLLDAAQMGQLTTAQQVRAQAERMLADDRAGDTIAHFHQQWLGMERLPEGGKDTDLFPEYTEALAASMQQEVGRFARQVVMFDDARLETLLTTRYAVVDAELADLYGVERPGGGWRVVELPGDQRSGVLTLASVMAAHAHHNQTSPVLRGVLVRENLLCQTPPPPPDTVNDNPPGLDPTLPTKERFEQHRNDPSCEGCHVILDPLGYGFESFDAIGRHRTMDGQFTVDDRGEIIGTVDIDGPFDGPVELTAALVRSEQVSQCVQTQWFTYANGRLATDADTCSLDVAAAAFEDSDLDIRELMLAIATSDAMRHLRPAQED